jgi:type II restriction enzyme
MKNLSTLRKLDVTNAEEGFQLLINTFRPSLKLWDYFVNWEKVFRNTKSLEVNLNIWNYLLGKEDFDSEFLRLLEEHPQIVSAIPALIVRDGSNSSVFRIVENISNLSVSDTEFDFSEPAVTLEARKKALSFVKNTGLVKLFHRDGVKNLVDYVLGVEAGLDSNARKNRSGTSMELVTAAYLQKFCNENNLNFIQQATSSQIESKWGFKVPVDKSARRFDFAISDGNTLVLMEVNFYGGGGSKLKATAGEFKGLAEMVKRSGFEFVWVTDGDGWKTTHLPLQEAYEKIDNIWNLYILNSGILRDLFK